MESASGVLVGDAWSAERASQCCPESLGLAESRRKRSAGEVEQSGFGVGGAGGNYEFDQSCPLDNQHSLTWERRLRFCGRRFATQCSTCGARASTVAAGFYFASKHS